MKVSSFEAIAVALNAAGVRFIVVGGLAVNAHGYLRFTNDVDLVIDLSERDIIIAFRALAEIGYHPSNPITAEEFAHAETRAHWRRVKGMEVLTMWSDAHRETPLDIFVYEPFDFDLEYGRALHLAAEFPAHFVSIPTLLAMKARAGRPQDHIDIAKLRQIQELSAK